MQREEGCWVARCTNLGTIAADPDLDTAWDHITRVCRAHLDYGLAKGFGLDELVKPVPTDIVEAYKQHGYIKLHFGKRFAAQRD